MANLTGKELAALEDQLGFEQVLCCKYRAAAQTCTEPDLKSKFTQCGDQHKQNFTTLLAHLK